ncbi:phosphonate C-P lyase system protein PhnH [Desulfotignum phosphitoxidans]|uniref:Phosphonate metabolism protein, PhnH n=1 Tax=Desulfotignum phosphitoxidans DSM 13687 TaxID=1286635 RepID=S0G834_9BACT|nr:phosphonate C-P lyase system protein PhnH [Desulfotignum phosphitoxidans]EMS81672.1 phosphonate metabolism protein, PhnH [Desulfotignum phosphitoxidans DSM 13687]
MTSLMKGFDSEVFDSQAVFRQLLNATAYPGTISGPGITLACPDRIHPGTGALLLTLLDFETPFWTDLVPDSPEVRWLKFHTGAPVTFDPFEAAFSLITDTSLSIDLNRFNPGTVIAPDRSTTLVIQTNSMTEGNQLRLTGPGIPKQTGLSFTGIAPDFWGHRTLINQSFPVGIDMIFVHKNRFCALPRTVHTEIS